MDREEVERIAFDVALRTAREVVEAAPTSGLLIQPSWVIATTTGSAGPGESVSLRVDGDEAELADAAQNATGQYLTADLRVVVLVRPSGGALVVGFAGFGSGVVTVSELSEDAAVLSLSVPVGATELEVRASLRSNAAALTDFVAVSFNSDYASTYSSAYLYHTGTTPKAFTEGDVGRLYAGNCHGNTAAATLFSPFHLDCFNAANATAQKEGLADSGSAGTTRLAHEWRWPQTAPISLIEIRPWNGTLWKAGSTAQLVAR